MISQGVISVLFACVSAHDGHSPYSARNNLTCYSCIYVEGKENTTNPGCELAKPPKEYQTTECFGYGNIKFSSDMRQSNTSLHSDGPHVVHCATVSGTTDSGAKIIFRGCDYRNETLRDKTCYDDSDFPGFGIGLVRNVKKCYCSTELCNSSNLLRLSYTTMLAGIFVTLFWRK